MSIVGIGTDIVDVVRVRGLLDRHGDRFLDRCFAVDERAHFAGKTNAALALSVAGRWAAKESFLKALGGAIAHIPYQSISVNSAIGGAPRLVVSGEAARALAKRGGRSLHLTISHEQQFAVAMVLIEA